MPIITAIQAIQKLPTDINFSEEKLSANIPAAEYRWGEKVLGKKFWADLIANIGTKTEYKVLWQQILLEYMAFAVLYESRMNIQWSISTQGFMLNNTEFSQSDQNGYKHISNFLSDRINVLQEKLNDFLTTYPSKFPLYPPNSDLCCDKPKYIEDFFGVNVSIKRSDCGCNDTDEPDFPDYVPDAPALQEFNVNCMGSIEVNGLYKNDVLIDMDLPKEFTTKEMLLTYLQGQDANWQIDNNYVKISSTDKWNITICCV